MKRFKIYGVIKSKRASISSDIIQTKLESRHFHTQNRSRAPLEVHISSLLHSINFYDPFGAECHCGCFELHTESDFSLFNTSFYGLCCASPIVFEFNSCAIMIIYISRLISIHSINPKYFQNILTTPDVFM